MDRGKGILYSGLEVEGGGGDINTTPPGDEKMNPLPDEITHPKQRSLYRKVQGGGG